MVVVKIVIFFQKELTYPKTFIHALALTRTQQHHKRSFIRTRIQKIDMNVCSLWETIIDTPLCSAIRMFSLDGHERLLLVGEVCCRDPFAPLPRLLELLQQSSSVIPADVIFYDV